MMKFRVNAKGILIGTLPIAFIVAIVWIITFSLMPPNREKMEQCFQRDKGDLSIITDYLINLDCSYTRIDKSDIKNGVMFTGANAGYEEIDDKTVLKSLNKILGNEGYISITKSYDTVIFKKWRFLQKERGIAIPVSKEKRPLVEFLIKSEPLSEFGWYYYEADYEESRNQ